MHPRDLTRLRAALTSRRDELQATLARVQQEVRNTSSAHADATDQAVASDSKNALQLMGEMAARQLRSLNEALQRIESGEYGDCMNCGHEISAKRLEALPSARLCVDCQELQESFSTR